LGELLTLEGSDLVLAALASFDGLAPSGEPCNLTIVTQSLSTGDFNFLEIPGSSQNPLLKFSTER
jgi:hypothetical protein